MAYITSFVKIRNLYRFTVFYVYVGSASALIPNYVLHFSLIRCNVSSIMLEMDRILRPGGHVYIRDSLSIMDELLEIAKAIGWQATLRDTAEGPHASYRILVCDKLIPHGWCNQVIKLMFLDCKLMIPAAAMGNSTLETSLGRCKRKYLTSFYVYGLRRQSMLLILDIRPQELIRYSLSFNFCIIQFNCIL